MLAENWHLILTFAIAGYFAHLAVRFVTAHERIAISTEAIATSLEKVEIAKSVVKQTVD